MACDSAPGPAGGSCSVVEKENGEMVLRCDDGSETVVSPGEAACSVAKNDEGKATITCADGTREVIELTGSAGPQGEAGPPCAATDNGDGSFTIACPGSDPITLRNGTDGENGADGAPGENGADGQNGMNGQPGADGRDGRDGQPGADGRDGRDGAACLAVNNGDGSYTITCPGSEPITVRNGENGMNGQNGMNGMDGMNGMNGQNGMDGQPCRLEENGDGSFSLNATQGPDEFHSGDDSCYVNAAAALNLRSAANFSAALGVPVPANWTSIAEKVRFPFDATREMHLEFAEWDDSMKAKQADTIMLR